MLVKLRICKDCGFIGPQSVFTVDGRKNPTNVCLKCSAALAKLYRTVHTDEIKAFQKLYRKKNWAKKLEKAKEWRKKNPEKFKATVRFSKYKLTQDDYDTMLVKQEDKCAICKRDFDIRSKFFTPHIDRNHACCTGQKSCGKCVRGLLCADCNKFMGKIKDDPEVSDRMSEYLRKNEYTAPDARQLSFAVFDAAGNDLQSN